MKSEAVSGWHDAFSGLGLDDLLSDHVTLSADEMTLISQQIQLRMQQTQLQVSDASHVFTGKENDRRIVALSIGPYQSIN